MNTIQEVKSWPVGTTIPAVKGRAAYVGKYTSKVGDYGPYTVQTVIIEDGGAEVPCSCWDFADLSHLNGQDVTVASTGKDRRNGNATGVTSKQGKDKDGNPRLELNIHHKKGGFIGSDTPNPAHTVKRLLSPDDMRAEAAAETPIPANPSPSKPQAKGIEGVTVGMAVNCAVRLCAANQIPPENQDEYIHEKASALIRLSQRLQAGELL